ncbi:MAG: sigma-70 family RNA polymerase sigma factor [Nitrospinae bacterium]|nr:sigma-70 family RNA polymerase sigma factor [Nitrospinota bacterium]
MAEIYDLEEDSPREEVSPNGFEKASKPSVPGADYGALAPADPLQIYIQKIKQYPALTREEELELAERFRETGDKDAAFRLVTSNLMLVVKISYEFRSQFQNMMDLIQEGNYGLLRAIRKFDPFRGARLSTYASYWIRAYILKYLLDNWRLVKVGTTNVRRKLLYNLRELQAQLEEGGIEAGPKLLAERFGATEQDVIDIQQSLGVSDASLNQPVDDEGKRELGETVASQSADVSEELANRQVMEKFHAAIDKFKQTLRPVDKDLLEHRLLSDNPLTLREIGEKHGVTREAIRQAEERLMKRLKTYLAGELKDVGEVEEAPQKPRVGRNQNR